MKRRRAWPLLTAVLASCAGPRLPYEGRVWLMDSEEELKTARARVREARRALDEAETALSQASHRRDGLSSESDPAVLAEAEAHVAYADATVQERQRALDLVNATENCADLALAAATKEAEVRAKLENADLAESKSQKEGVENCYNDLTPLRTELDAASWKRASARAALERAKAKANAAAPATNPYPYLE